MSDMTKEEYGQKMKEEIDLFLEYIENYDDLPNKMSFEEWNEQYIAFTELREDGRISKVLRRS